MRTRAIYKRSQKEKEPQETCGLALHRLKSEPPESLIWSVKLSGYLRHLHEKINRD